MHSSIRKEKLLNSKITYRSGLFHQKKNQRRFGPFNKIFYLYKLHIEFIQYEYMYAL